VSGVLGAPSERALHWDAVYRARATDELSWHQAEPRISLDLVAALGIAPDTPVLDVGGGASTLVDGLLERGFRDLTVLDVSDTALELGRHRLGTRIAWLREDIVTWRPARRYGLWHDRAVLHFLGGAADRDGYLRALHAAVPRGSVIVGAFAPSAPDHCSGLPVTRYSAAELAGMLGGGFELLETREETHQTPDGTSQPFTWIAGRLQS
jgi:hypothetical protein